MKLKNKIEKQGWTLVGHQWSDATESGIVTLSKQVDVDGDGQLDTLTKNFPVSSFAEIAELYGIATDADKEELKTLRKAERARKQLKKQLAG